MTSTDLTPEIINEPEERVFGYRAVAKLRRTASAIAHLKPDLGVLISVERYMPDRATPHPSPSRNSLMGGLLVFYCGEHPDHSLPVDSSGHNYPNIPFTD